MVVANILAEVLIELAPQVVAALSSHPQHALVLSGILECQYHNVTATYAALGFKERKSILLDEWRSGWFVRL